MQIAARYFPSRRVVSNIEIYATAHASALSAELISPVTATQQTSQGS